MIPKKVSSVALVAMGHTMPDVLRMYGAHHKRPYKNIWGINRIALWLHDVDLVFSIDDLKHPVPTIQETVRQREAYAKTLNARGIPIVTAHAYNDLPNTVEYPLQWVVDKLELSPRMARRLLNNSLCYAFAYAIAADAKEIGIFGADFFYDDAYKVESVEDQGWRYLYLGDNQPRQAEPGQAQMAFLMAFAMSRGISVKTPAGSTLLNNHWPDFFYGYTRQPVLRGDEE
jgi:hypothetical protein